MGDATATGEISLGGNASIAGAEVEYIYPPLVFTEIDTSVYLDESNQGTPIEGDFEIKDEPNYELGPTHITGSLTITGNKVVKLTGTVWVDGTITMDGNSQIEGAATIVAVGDIQVLGNAELTADNIPPIISISGNITVTGNG